MNAQAATEQALYSLHATAEDLKLSEPDKAKLLRACAATLESALHAQAEEIERLRGELELRRASGSAVDRLHNICEAIAAEADGSEFSREEWNRIDAENVALQQEIKQLRAERKAVRLTTERAEQLIVACGGSFGMLARVVESAVLKANGIEI